MTRVRAMTDLPAPRIGSRPLSLRVTPAVVPSGREAFVHVRIEPDPGNRTLEIEWQAAGGAHGWHVFLIDGDRGAIRYQHTIRALLPGDYEVSATLTRIDGTSVRRAAMVTVLGGAIAA